MAAPHDQLKAVRVTVHRAQLLGLAGAAAAETLFVTLRIGESKRRTAQAQPAATLDWNETFEMVVGPTDNRVDVKAVATNEGKEVEVGVGTVDLRELDGAADGILRRQRVLLEPAGHPAGWVELSVVADWRVQRDLKASAAAALALRSIMLTVHSIRGVVPSQRGLEVTVRLLPGKNGDVFTTAVQPASEPMWQESHEFDVRNEKEFHLQVVWDGAERELLGEIQVPLKELALHRGPGSRWVPLFKGQQHAGEILLQYEPREEFGGGFVRAGAGSPKARPVVDTTQPSEISTAATPTSLKVTVVEGQKLKARLKAFVEVHVGTESFRTPVVLAPNPRWGTSRKFDLVRNPTNEVTFVVHGAGELAGHAIVPLEEITHTGTHKLAVEHNGKNAGTLVVHLEPKFERAAEASSPKGAHLPREVVSLSVRVIEAKELTLGRTHRIARMSPYVRVATMREQWMTKALPQVRNPRWNESATFTMAGLDSLAFELCDQAVMDRAPLAATTVRLQDLPLFGKPIHRWLRLLRTDGQPAGQLQVCFTPTFARKKPAAPPRSPAPGREAFEVLSPGGKRRRIAELRRLIDAQYDAIDQQRRQHRQSKGELQLSVADERETLRQLTRELREHVTARRSASPAFAPSARTVSARAYSLPPPSSLPMSVSPTLLSGVPLALSSTPVYSPLPPAQTLPLTVSPVALPLPGLPLSASPVVAVAPDFGPGPIRRYRHPLGAPAPGVYAPVVRHSSLTLVGPPDIERRTSLPLQAPSTRRYGPLPPPPEFAAPVGLTVQPRLFTPTYGL